MAVQTSVLNVSARRSFGIALLMLLAAWRTWGATFDAQGTNLTVASNTVQVSFAGADVVGITNRLTGEQYLRNASTNTQLNLTLVQAPNQALAASGNWTVNSSGTSATLSFSDSNRTIYVTVSVDGSTQEVVFVLDGKASLGGAERLIWGASGFDLSIGKFIVPAAGGLSLTNASFQAANSFTFSTSNPSSHWEAPLSLFQSAQGGVAIYSTDLQSAFKDLNFSTNQRQTVNELFEVEAPGPWNTATEVGPIEWRLAAYGGDWQTGARIYRDWHNTAFPAVPLTGSRAWASNIRTVVKFGGAPPYTASLIDPLIQVVDPTKTLIYLVNWRTSSYDINYPDYTPHPTVKALVDHAHQLGFHVMLHTDMIGVSPLNPDWGAVQQFQAKDPLSLQLQGWNWTLPSSTTLRYGYIDPASVAYRTLFVNRITSAIQTLSADAIHLDIAGWPINDGNGLFAGMNYNQGAAQLQRDLLAAFPGLILGTEGTNDTISPYGSFQQQIPWSAPLSVDVTPPVPISAYVLPNVQPYGHLGQPSPDEGGFLEYFTQYEQQAVLPTFWFNQGQADFAQADWARYMKLAGAFQSYSLRPAWDTNWNGLALSYSGANGVSASLTDTGTVVQFNVQQSGGSTLIYQRAHASTQIGSPPWVPDWPAYTNTLTLGLDPAYQYWLDGFPNSSDAPHITSLPSGVKLGLGTGTLVTPQFAYFQLLPPASTSFDFFENLWVANAGVTYNGADFPLGGGATANLQTMVVGGSSRKAIFMQPPFTAQRGGEVFVEYSVPLPAGNGASLSFAAGILDAAIGKRQDAMSFRVEINGTTLWQEDVFTGAWQAGNIDLTSYLGQTIKIRFVSNPGPSGNPNFGWGGFSSMQLSVAADDRINGVMLSVPPALTSAGIAITGGSASVGNGTGRVDGLPPGGTVLVFSGQSTPVSAGQSLFSIPFTTSQSSAGELAGPARIPGAGSTGPASSGGVTKQQTLYGFSPSDGQTILSWYLRLPATPLAFSFSAGYWDTYTPFPQGFLMSVRVNGIVLWHYAVNTPAAWEYGAVDLSSWSGQTVVLELITDSQGRNTASFTSWAELTFSNTGRTNFTVTNLGGVALTSSGTASSTQSGFGLIQAASASTMPAGLAIFDYRPNGVLLSETAVPATTPLLSGRIHVEIGNSVDTGLAIANPNNSIATISFTFTNSSGVDVSSGTTTIAANSQLSVFLDQSPFNGPSSFQGAFSFNSTMPVGAIALRSLINQRGDFLMSTLTVIDTTALPNLGTIVVPHFSDGSGWTTHVFLVNPTNNSMNGSIQFTKDDGTPATVTIAGQTASSFSYSVAGRSSFQLTTSGTNALVSGSIRVVPAGAGVAPTPLATFSYAPAGITLSEAGVSAASGMAFRMYAESAGVVGQSGNIQSGIAIANNGSTPASVILSLTDLTGTAVGVPVTANVPPSGHVAQFLEQFFAGQTLPNPFKGVVRISTTSSASISVVGLRTRYNERMPAPDFLITTTPPSLETAPATAGPLCFPEIADGGGYTTQLILFSGTAGSSANGTVTFTKQDGTSFILTLQ